MNLVSFVCGHSIATDYINFELRIRIQGLEAEPFSKLGFDIRKYCLNIIHEPGLIRQSSENTSLQFLMVIYIFLASENTF